MGAEPRRVTFVLGTTAGGTGTHVRMLAAGLARRGVGVRLAGPARTAAGLGLDALADVRFTPVELSDRPRPADVKAVLTLRRLLTAPGTRPDVTHAHGMRAGALTAIALTGTSSPGTPGLPRVRGPKLIVTVHNAPPPGGRAARLVYLALERIVARRADLVLAVSSDVENRVRAAGARNLERAVVPAPGPPVPAEAAPGSPPVPDDGRPLILAVGRLAPQKGFATLLDAARAWQHLTPKPRLLIAGDGPARAGLEARAREHDVDAEFPGHRSDIPELLARARVFVMPSLWEGQPLALAEALRAGVPIVASNAGGIGDMAGDIDAGGAAVLVQADSQRELGQAVLSVLDDDALAGRLRDAARRRAATLPAAADAVTAALAAYTRVLA